MTKLVVDANRIISALLRDGSTRAAILKTGAALFAPAYLLEEIERHLPDIAERVGVAPEELRPVLALLLRRVEWVPAAAYEPHLKRAKAALGKTDPKDVPYLACALAVGADAIWSHDTDFDEQGLVPRVPHPDAPIL